MPANWFRKWHFIGKCASSAQEKGEITHKNSEKLYLYFIYAAKPQLMGCNSKASCIGRWRPFSGEDRGKHRKFYFPPKTENYDTISVGAFCLCVCLCMLRVGKVQWYPKNYYTLHVVYYLLASNSTSGRGREPVSNFFARKRTKFSTGCWLLSGCSARWDVAWWQRAKRFPTTWLFRVSQKFNLLLINMLKSF